MGKKQNKGSGSKKYGRNENCCKNYLMAGTLARNQLRRVSRHVRQSIRHMNRFNERHYTKISYDQSARSWLTEHGKEIKL